MLVRNLKKALIQLLNTNAAVVLTGPRQVGKTTLALCLQHTPTAVYRDLENPRELDQVRDIELFVEQYPGQLIILDEVQRLPELFAPLRGIIDARRREGLRKAQFLLLGSASLDLLNQTSESLTRRIAYLELAGLDVLELRHGADFIQQTELWLRGGFPESLLAQDAKASLQWRRDLIRSYLERDVPQFGFRVPAETLRRFWTMLAHHQGGLFNAATLAKSLGVSGQSVARHLDVLVDLLLVRRLQPWHANVGKRLIKGPKVYIRDSGLLHSLLDIEAMDQLLGHPVAGNSWEGFVIENIINVCSEKQFQPYFYRTHSGAEIDLLLVKAGVPKIAIEIKLSLAPKVEKGFHIACEDLQVEQRFVVYPGKDTYLLSGNVQVISLEGLALKLTE